MELSCKHPVTIASIEKISEALNRQLGKATHPEKAGLYFQRPIISGLLVVKLSSCLRKAFCGKIGYPLALIGSISCVWSIATIDIHSIQLDRSQIAQSFAIYILSIIIHELGHASALFAEGKDPGPIGVGLYFLLPAFYVDVTNAWTLQRSGRIKVDLGGCYFQAIFLAATLLLSVISNSPSGLVASWYIAITIFINMIPALKLDGSWALSDYLGVTNTATYVWCALKDRIFSKQEISRRILIGLWLFAAGSAVYIIWLLKITSASLTTLMTLFRHGSSLASFKAIQSFWMALVGLFALGYMTLNTLRVARKHMRR